MTDKVQLVSILKDLRSYIANEYNLNVDDRSLKGEGPSEDTSLPADWQEKLEPISGGPGGEKEGDKGAEKKATAAGSQGKDAYLHKEGDETYERSGESPLPESEVPHHSQAMADDGNGDMEEEEMPVEEVMDEDNGMEDVEKAGMYAMHGDEDEVVSLLRDIKGFLENASMAKQNLAGIEAVRSDVASLTKSLPGIIDSRIKDGTTSALKSFGMRPAGGDVPRRTNKRPVEQTRQQVVKEAPVAVPQSELMDSPAAIGVEGDSLMKASSQVSDHEQFVGGVKQLVDMTDVDDLKGTFRRINKMREDSGENLAHNLYYF